MFDELYKHWNNVDRHHDRMDDEFRRLYAEPCMKPANPGDRVVVAIGFLGMGHLWVRAEAIVLEVGGGSVKVRFTNRNDYYTKEPMELWVHPALIVDVFEAESKADV